MARRWISFSCALAMQLPLLRVGRSLTRLGPGWRWSTGARDPFMCCSRGCALMYRRPQLPRPLPEPMLARAGLLPTRGRWAYEVKWDGFWTLVRAGADYSVRSRRGWTVTT